MAVSARGTGGGGRACGVGGEMRFMHVRTHAKMLSITYAHPPTHPPTHPAGSPPLFAYGHSLGGLVAALTCARDQRAWAGLIMTGPAVDVEWNLVLRWALRALCVLVRWLAGAACAVRVGASAEVRCAHAPAFVER
jgi:alpha-beta hydrolase superfamily lysophospholipase